MKKTKSQGFEDALRRAKPLKIEKMNNWQFTNLARLIPKSATTNERNIYISRIRDKIN